MQKNVLELSNVEAKEFFLREESYFTFDLPKYFSFNKLLEKVDKKILWKNLDTFFLMKDNPNNYEDVNYTIFHNKNWKYSRRCLELINPAIYVSLVHTITEEKNRKTIIKAFKSFKKWWAINCLSIPLITNKWTKNKQMQANQWWEHVEQKSISLSLEYNYLFETDIVDCYGSIYTHSIVRALHTKKTGKDQRKNDTLIWNIIDKHIQYMSNWQTNWIPQWSILMDFIAEMFYDT